MLENSWDGIAGRVGETSNSTNTGKEYVSFLFSVIVEVALCTALVVGSVFTEEVLSLELSILIQ